MRGDIYVAIKQRWPKRRWKISVEGDWTTQQQAWDVARGIAKALEVEAVRKGLDGKIKERNTYGDDPEEYKN